jgi:hypothetical protein
MQVTGIHPLADLFPMMAKGELRALADDIRANGLLDAIKLTEAGVLVDGRNRQAACELAGIEPRYEVVNGDAADLIIAANVMRRQMTKGQIAILAVIAELGIDLSDDGSSEEEDGPLLGGSKKYDYQKAAHKRVEGLVSPSVINNATHIVRWAPDHARGILKSGLGWKEAQETAEERSKTAHSEGTRRDVLADDSPDLLALTEGEKGITIGEAWRLRETRQREEKDKRIRLTGYLVDRVTPLLGKTNPEELVDGYDPDLASRKVTVEDLDEAIGYLKALRTAMVRAKKG